MAQKPDHLGGDRYRARLYVGTDPATGPDLLRRYVAHVRRTIGDKCLLRTDRLLSARKGITFTDDEWAHLWSMVADD